jgi:hypothetical protein
MESSNIVRMNRLFILLGENLPKSCQQPNI